MGWSRVNSTLPLLNSTGTFLIPCIATGVNLMHFYLQFKVKMVTHLRVLIRLRQHNFTKVSKIVLILICHILLSSYPISFYKDKCFISLKILQKFYKTWIFGLLGHDAVYIGIYLRTVGGRAFCLHLQNRKGPKTFSETSLKLHRQLWEDVWKTWDLHQHRWQEHQIWHDTRVWVIAREHCISVNLISWVCEHVPMRSVSRVGNEGAPVSVYLSSWLEQRFP